MTLLTNSLGNNEPPYDGNAIRRRQVAIASGLVLFFGFVAFVWYRSTTSETTPTDVPGLSQQTAEPAAEVQITPKGLLPQTIRIRRGETVRWTNTDGAIRRIAADPYPTHEDLPALDSLDLPVHQTYSFQFEQTGQFHYHDHTRPTVSGTVIVEE